MSDYKLSIRLNAGGVTGFFDEFETDYYRLDLKQDKTSVIAVLTAKKDLCLNDFELTTERSFGADDLFFANGFQSWSITEEHK